MSGSGKKFDTFIVNTKIQQYFDICWRLYPKKVGKLDGEKAFRKLIGKNKLGFLDQYCEFFLKRVNAYAEMCNENNTDPQYILHFSTFCNSKKYL